MTHRVLEIGKYIAPAYAGMLLAEAGLDVTRVVSPDDPLYELDCADAFDAWLNARKTIVRADRALTRADVAQYMREYDCDVVVSNLRRLRNGISACTWVHIVPVHVERSFDIIAQAQAWGDFAGMLRCYVGDTIAGLWAAYVVLAHVGRHVYVEIPHAAALVRLVEGELMSPLAERRQCERRGFDGDVYDADDAGAVVVYRGREYREPYRDLAWRRAHLPHVDGRIVFPVIQNE